MSDDTRALEQAANLAEAKADVLNHPNSKAELYESAHELRALAKAAIAACDSARLETVQSTCPRCGKSVASYWHSDNSGCESHPDYVLVADAVFHSRCWDELVEVQPPGQEPEYISHRDMDGITTYSVHPQGAGQAVERHREFDKTHVICPNCAHDFRAISESDQERIRRLEEQEAIDIDIRQIAYDAMLRVRRSGEIHRILSAPPRELAVKDIAPTLEEGQLR